MAIMRSARSVLAAMLVAGACGAQSPDDGAYVPLRHGRLVVWIVRPGADAARVPNGDVQPPPTGLQETTPGSFGQTASTYGQTAGSVGLPSDTSKISTPAIPAGADAAPAASDGTGYHEQTSGSFGQTSGSFGTESSNHGTNASNVGQTSGSYGTEASNHGQTAGSFGNSLDGVANAGQQQRLNQGSWVMEVKAGLQAKFPELQIQVVDVGAASLRASLKAAEGKLDYPDVLVGPLPDYWKPETSSRYLVSVSYAEVPNSIGVQPSQSPASVFFPPVFVLARGRHLAVAKAFVQWYSQAEETKLRRQAHQAQ